MHNIFNPMYDVKVGQVTATRLTFEKQCTKFIAYYRKQKSPEIAAIQGCDGYGERGRIRTCDPRLKRPLLYRLSYAPI